jgi:hypothetical protein
MARNKRNESALRAGPVLTTVALCAVFVMLGVGYVWYKNQIDLLGRQIKDRELRLVELQRQNKMRRDQLATLCSPVALDALVKRLDLGLGPPDKSQVIWMVEPAPAPQTAGPPAQDGARTRTLLAKRKN